MRSIKRMAGAVLALTALQAGSGGAQTDAAKQRAVEASLWEARAAMAGVGASMSGMRGSMAGVGASMAQARLEMVEAQASLAGLGARAYMGSRGGRRAVAPEPWLQEDPGAKVYAAAREALNNRRYEAAAQSFAQLRKEYPGSGYVPDSYYWQAFALYRQGGMNSYRAAVELLDVQKRDHPQAATQSDAAELRVRLEAQLARQGDARAAENITRQATQPCDGEDQEVRASALSALLNMNADQAMPILRRVLQQRDECSAELRRQAVFLISQKMTDESVGILLDLAHRNPDPDPEVREQAVFWLSQVKSDEALDALESILSESKDPDLQEKAIFSISQHKSERAAQILRQYAERTDAPKDLRANAIFWIGQSPRNGGTSYLIQLYPRLGDPELKEKAIFAIAQGKSDASRRWLLDRARDRSESVDVRKNALFWAGQTGGLSAAELKELYGTLSEPEMKEQVIFVASQKHETQAVDFLMDVATNEKDKDLRQRAIFWLGQSKDPRVAEFLMNLIGG